jgi:hypothetical protein
MPLLYPLEENFSPFLQRPDCMSISVNIDFTFSINFNITSMHREAMQMTRVSHVSEEHRTTDYTIYL